MKHYRKNPEILIAVKHPKAPLTTVKADTSFRSEFLKIIGAEYELHVLVNLPEGGAIIMAVDEYGKFKKELMFNFNYHHDPIMGTAIFIKEDGNGNVVSLNEKDLKNLRGYVGQREQNPRTDQASVVWNRSKPCPHCQGEGLVFDGLCPMCNGRGKVTKYNRNPIEPVYVNCMENCGCKVKASPAPNCHICLRSPQFCSRHPAPNTKNYWCWNSCGKCVPLTDSHEEDLED